MTQALNKLLSGETKKLRDAGLYKPARGPRGVGAAARMDFTGFDYLALRDDPRLREAASAALAEHGVGEASTGLLPTGGALAEGLERRVSQLVGKPAAALFSSGYAANVGLFESLFDSRDCVLCDAWVHPSVGAGIRLSGAKEVPFRASRLEELEDRLKRSRSARFRAIAVDGVCAISGEVAPLGEICDLARRYEALVIVDDSLGVGVLGKRGGGSAAARQVIDKVDVVTSSCAKALGAGGGGFVAASAEIVDWIKQKAQTYLFSSPLSPVHGAAAKQSVELLANGQITLDGLADRVRRLREGLQSRGFEVLGGSHPNVCIRVGDVVLLQRMISQLFEASVRVHGLCYPVVPERQARLRMQVSLHHDQRAIDKALDAMEGIGHELRII